MTEGVRAPPPIPSIGVSTGVPAGVLPLPYCSARAATSSRQKAGMSGTTRPQTEWETVAGVLEPSPTVLPSSGAGLLSLGWCAWWCGTRGPTRGRRTSSAHPGRGAPGGANLYAPRPYVVSGPRSSPDHKPHFSLIGTRLCRMPHTDFGEHLF